MLFTTKVHGQLPDIVTKSLAHMEFLEEQHKIAVQADKYSTLCSGGMCEFRLMLRVYKKIIDLHDASWVIFVLGR